MIDQKFYSYQSRIRGITDPVELLLLCKNSTKNVKNIIEKIILKSNINKNIKALDAPCGYGNMLYLYEKLNINSVGIDLDKNQIELSNKINKTKAINANLINYDYKDTFDIISSLDFIEHIDKSTALNVLMKFNSLLNTNGYLILRLPCADSPLGTRDFANDPTHKWIASTDCIRSYLKMSNFSNITIHEDWPRFHRYHHIREPIAKVMRFVIRNMLQLAGYGKLDCISTSMIVVAQKSKDK